MNRRVAAGVAVLLGLAALIYIPARWERARLQDQVDEAKQALGIGNDPGKLRELHSRVEELRLASQQSQGYVPPTDELAQVLRGLTESMTAFGATVHEVVVGDVEQYRDYHVIPIRMRFHGPFPAAYGVLKQVEAMSRLIRIEDLKIDSDPRNPQAPVSVELELNTFYAPAEASDALSRQKGGRT